jgi:hypothetical protein
MRSWVVALLLSISWLIPADTKGQGAAPARSDEELKAHVEELGRRLDDPLTDLAVRERLALEISATLDRAAQSASTPELRRGRWAEAVAVLDKFTSKNSGHPQARSFQVQAAVYVWAIARSWMQVYETTPTDAEARRLAVENLLNCLQRLKPVSDSLRNVNEKDVFAQNVRFRTAQARADLAELGPNDAAIRRERYAEALSELSRPITEPSLEGFADLLRASLMTRLGRFDDAKSALASAAKARPAPPEAEQVETRVELLLGMKQHAEALKAIDASRLDQAARTVLRARVRLDECGAKPDGPERSAAESALFGELRQLRASASHETRGALIAAARALREPGADQEPDAWDLLAEGAAASGDQARAGALEGLAAERAVGLGRPPQAAEFRLRAGAYLFQSEKFAEADRLLTRVVEDPGAGPARARAGILRSLARGRILALGLPGASQQDYAAALQYQIKTFPDDPSASEARWLLGKLRLAQSNRDSALELWAAIPHGSPRWLESRVEIAAIRQSDLDNQRLNNDREAVKRRLADARSFLARCLDDARGDAEINEVLLASARLEFTPGVGRPDEAARHLERVLRSVARPAQRDQARRLSIVAQAQSNRWTEAEQATRSELTRGDPIDLLPLARLLDRSAAEAESDLRTRRIGYLLRILLAPLQQKLESLPREVRTEVKLRMARALLFTGDDASARRMFSGWTPPSASSGNELLRDLADTYARLDAFAMAVDVQRLRSKLAPTGSLPWFDARYGLALAYFRSGKTTDALHLIEATAILHPDLGGGELRDKFLRLQQRINPTD